MEYSVLIIDDDIWMQRILSKTMQSYGFNKTYLASNGFDGIALAIDHLPNLIVLDILMPELSGLLTLKILKRISITQKIPVLVVSAKSDTEHLGNAVKCGVSGFISKPFTRATIYEKLLDIFGNEKLNMISRGEIVEELVNNNIPNKTISQEKDESQSFEMFISDSPEIKNISTQDKAAEKKTNIQKDQLLQHYNEEEKHSIESIRKMLMKK